MVRNNIIDYKKQLAADIANNSNIIEAIASKSKDYIEGQGDTLLGVNIFPYLRVPNITNESETYLGIEVEILNENKVNSAFHNWRVTLWVMAHKDHVYMKDKGCSRIDYISDELKKMFQNSQKYGFGMLNLTSNKAYVLNPKYSYRQLEFTTCDLKKSVCNNV